MPEARTAASAGVEPVDLNDPHKALRQLGARAHQLRATMRAADHFNARDSAEDRHTGSWLVSTALGLAGELAVDADNLARALKDQPADAALRATIGQLRVRAHQLHASTRAADHFLDLDSREDHDTGTWLVATALTVARRLADELDDAMLPAAPRRPATAAEAEADPAIAMARRVAAAAGGPRRSAG